MLLRPTERRDKYDILDRMIIDFPYHCIRLHKGGVPMRSLWGSKYKAPQHAKPRSFELETPHLENQIPTETQNYPCRPLAPHLSLSPG